MADSPQLYHDEVAAFADDWYAFRGMLDPREREHWDALVDEALNRPYAGHCQDVDDVKWPVVFSVLVAQQRRIAALEAAVGDGAETGEDSESEASTDERRQTKS
jgi:hypothetical protein